MTLWDEVKRNIVNWYETAADKTGELAKVGLRRYDIFGISRDIERQFSEIGSHVYNALKEGRTDFADDPVLASLVAKVDALEQELQRKQEEIERIKAEHAARARQAEAAAAAAAGATDGSAEQAAATDATPGTTPETAGDAEAGSAESQERSETEDPSTPKDPEEPDRG